MRIAQMLALAMLLGSIPFGYIINRSKTGDRAAEVDAGTLSDHKKFGAARMALVLLLDAAKGFVPVYLANGLIQSDYLVVTVGIVAILSHCFPYWFMFRPSGNGVLPGLGVVFALNPLAGAIALVVWVIGLLIFRISSIAIIIAAVSVPISLKALGAPMAYILFGLLGMAYVVIAHMPNIATFINGTEPISRS